MYSTISCPALMLPPTGTLEEGGGCVQYNQLCVYHAVPTSRGTWRGDRESRTCTGEDCELYNTPSGTERVCTVLHPARVCQWVVVKHAGGERYGMGERRRFSSPCCSSDTGGFSNLPPPACCCWLAMDWEVLTRLDLSGRSRDQDRRTRPESVRCGAGWGGRAGTGGWPVRVDCVEAVPYLSIRCGFIRKARRINP